MADLDALAEFRDPEQPGWTRRVFSAPYVRSREWLAAAMRDAGMRVQRDAAGNLIGTLPADGGRPALVSGSHTDTVASGGRFDGPVGVLGAIEAVRCINESGRKLRHEVRVVDFVGEEPNDFGISCVGSRAIAGSLTTDHLALRDPSGRTLAEALSAVGGDAAQIQKAVWSQSDVNAFVELHIEQGPVLERARIPIGIVSGIAGIERLELNITGQADHAGTTPMDARHDALAAGAEVILAVERLAVDGHGVATTGRIDARPGAANVVPGEVQLWIELRSTDAEWLDSKRLRLADHAVEISNRRGVQISLSVQSRTEPVATSEEVRSAMTDAVGGLGFESLSLPSGAGHDAVQMARLGPIGMLFVPSVGGRSHCPEESTLPEHLEAGVSALLATLLVLDER